MNLQNFPENVNLENLLKIKFTKKFKVIFIMITIVLMIISPFYLIAMVFIYFSLKKYLEQLQIHRAFMKSFAERNNFSYIDFSSTKNLTGRLFNIGNSRRVLHMVSGFFEKYPIQIFNYYHTVGSGKNSHTYSFTVCEIEIERTKFPHIFLKSDSMWRYQMQDFFGQNKDVKISLEKGFDAYFDLYCTQDYETETLQIFTVDILDYLSKSGSNFSIEFSENKIYIYDDLIIRKQEELDQLYEVVKKILNSSQGLFDRLHDDFDSLHSVYNKKIN